MIALLFIISWLPNPEPDVSGYMIYFGEFSGVYDRSVHIIGREYKIETSDKLFVIVTALDFSGNESDPSDEIQLNGGLISDIEEEVQRYEIVWPNPFENEIYFEGADEVKIFNVRGEEIALVKDSWNSSGVASGVYFCRIKKGDDFTSIRKITKL